MSRGYGVFIPSYSTSDQDLIAALAGVAGLSQTDAQIILSSHLPRKVFTTKTDSEAQDRVRLLRTAGFGGFVVSFDALAGARALQVHAASFTSDGLTLEPLGAFRPGALRLIVHGEFRSGHDIERTVTTYSRGLSGFRFTPNQETTHDRSSSSEQFVHLYGESTHPVFELRPQRFNFRCLGEDFAVSAALNLKSFLQRLRTHSPNLRYDDTLLKFPPIPDDVVVSDQVVGGNPVRVEVVQHKQGNEEAATRASVLLALSILHG